MNKELLYVYGLIPAYERDPNSNVTIKTKRRGDVLAVFDVVDPLVFAQQQIERYADDPVWVKEKAVSHHNVIAMLQQRYTVIPLPFCTIFEDSDNLEAMLSRHEDEIKSLFKTLKGKEEWNLKVYCSMEIFMAHVMQNSNEAMNFTEQLSSLSPGKQFLMRKQMTARLELLVEDERRRICLAVHESLSSAAYQTSVKKVWDRKMTGRVEEMIWNSVYLTDSQKIDAFMLLVKQYNDEFQAAGLFFEATGPWPIYHFANAAFSGSVR
jgi:Gas vesicle synthesis protein GvpL/GvpF.